MSKEYKRQWSVVLVITIAITYFPNQVLADTARMSVAIIQCNNDGFCDSFEDRTSCPTDCKAPTTNHYTPSVSTGLVPAPLPAIDQISTPVPIVVILPPEPPPAPLVVNLPNFESALPAPITAPVSLSKILPKTAIDRTTAPASLVIVRPPAAAVTNIVNLPQLPVAPSTAVENLIRSLQKTGILVKTRVSRGSTAVKSVVFKVGTTVSSVVYAVGQNIGSTLYRGLNSFWGSLFGK